MIYTSYPGRVDTRGKPVSSAPVVHLAAPASMPQLGAAAQSALLRMDQGLLAGDSRLRAGRRIRMASAGPAARSSHIQ